MCEQVVASKQFVVSMTVAELYAIICNMKERSSEVGFVHTLVSAIERTGALGAWMAIALGAVLTATGIWLCFFASGAKRTLEVGGGMEAGEVVHHIFPTMLSICVVGV